MVFLLYLSQSVRAIVRIPNVILVDLDTASGGSKNEIDDVGHGLRLVLLEARDPLRGDILEVVATREHVGCDAVSDCFPCGPVRLTI